MARGGSRDGSAPDAGATDAGPSDAGAPDATVVPPGSVGPAGGTVQVGNDPAGPQLTLVVPPGALPAPTAITITPIAASAGRWAEWAVDPLETRLTLAETQLQAFRVTATYDRAALLALSLSALMQQMGDDMDVDMFLAHTADAACSALTDAVTAAMNSNSRCPEDWKRQYGEPMMSWARVALAVSGASVNVCLPLSHNDITFYADVAGHKETQLAQLIDRGAPDGIGHDELLTCQCNARRPSEWTPAMALECPMLGAPGLPQAMPLSTFGVAADALLYVSADETQLGDIELGTDDTVEKADLGTPFETDLIGWAHTNCLQSGNAADLGRLLRRAPDDAAARADAQHCGSALAIQVNDATGGSIGSVTLGPGPTPAGNAPGTGMRLVKNGSVALTGPIAALHCVTSDESAETIENDTLLVTVVSAAGETSLHTETPDLDGTMLSAPLTFSTEALQQAAGVSDGGSIELHASRRSPGCGGLYGADGDVTRLFTLTFSTPSPACPTCGSGSFCYKGSCCTPAHCGDGVETGPSCGVGDDGCGGTLDCGACPPPGPCKPFFTKDQCITKNQQGDVTYQRCGLWADGCASAGVPENVDCGACPSGQWCESGHCTVCPDCSIYSIISLGCGLNQTVCGPIMCSAC